MAHDNPEDPKNQGHNEEDLSNAEAFLSEEAPAPDQFPPATPANPHNRPTNEPVPPSENTIDHEAFDKRLYGEIFEASDELSYLPDHEAAPETMPELLEDFFYAFFKVKPKLLEPADLAEEHARVNLPFVERLLEDERTALLRVSTCMDDMASALGALEAGRNTIEEIENRPDLADWITPPPEDEDQEQNSEEPDDDDSTPHGKPQEPPQRDMRRLMRQSLEAAQQAVDNYAEALGGWGLSPGDLQKVPLSERLEIARRLRSPKMAGFAALLGRMRDAATSAAAMGLTSGTDDVHSITTGGPIHCVLPQELAAGLGGDSTLETNFYRKRTEGSLLSYELTSPEEKQRGPIVAMVDASPSMSGSPMDWAAALAAALAQGPAAKEGRPVHLLYFNTQVVKEVELAPHEKDPKKLLDIVTVGTSGGTDFDAPIKRALEIVGISSEDSSSSSETSTTEFENADLILVTDGQCRLSKVGISLLTKAQFKTGLSLYAVLCGPGASAADVERYATKVYSAERDLAGNPSGDEIATDIFRRF